MCYVVHNFCTGSASSTLATEWEPQASPIALPCSGDMLSGATGRENASAIITIKSP